MLPNMRPNVAEEEIDCSFLISDSLRYGGLSILGKSELSLNTSLGETCRDIKKCMIGTLGLGYWFVWGFFM